MSETIRVAVIQSGSICFEPAATVERLEKLVRQAGDQGAELAVFPEAYIGGYPKGASFGASVGMRSPEGREWFQRYYAGAVEISGVEIQRLRELAAELEMILVGGVIERDGGTLFCTTVYIGRDGKLLGKHRKVMPTAMERLIWGFGDGSTLRAVDTPIGVIGGAICWENYMPALRLHQYAQGVEFYCTPTVDDRDQWQHAIRHIAWEGRCFVLSACQFATRGDFPEAYKCEFGDDPETILIRGGSTIVSPMGEILAGPEYNCEAVLVADLDKREIARGKFDLDVVGHYSRPDIFQLKVNIDAQKPVLGITKESS